MAENYAHADSTRPDTQAVLGTNMGPLLDGEGRAIAAGNAARIIGHPRPERVDGRRR